MIFQILALSFIVGIVLVLEYYSWKIIKENDIEKTQKISGKLTKIKECCETCKDGCRHSNGESFCIYRQKWQFSDFRCAGYKLNLRTVWKRFVKLFKRK